VKKTFVLLFAFFCFAQAHASEVRVTTSVPCDSQYRDDLTNTINNNQVGTIKGNMRVTKLDVSAPGVVMNGNTMHKCATVRVEWGKCDTVGVKLVCP
jgi:hypothetical protein